MDFQEGQFRRYDTAGKLLAHFGSRGRGPGEFQRPGVSVRLPSNEILVADRNFKIAILDSSGSRLVRTVLAPVRAIDDADVVDDSTVLLAGLEEDHPASARLHLWDYSRNRIRRSFFSPWNGYVHKDVASMAGWVQATVRADTIAVIFAPSDTLYLFSIEGEHLLSIPIPSRHFRMPGPLPEAGRTNAQARREWQSTFDLVTAVYWIAPDRFLLPYQTFVNGRPVWKLLGMIRTGELWFDDRDTPRLIEADSLGERLVFIANDVEARNRWAMARLRLER